MDALKPWQSKIVERYDGRCEGSLNTPRSSEDEQRIAALAAEESLQNAAAEAAAARERIAREATEAKLASAREVERLRRLPAQLQKLPLAEFCLAYGQAIREDRSRGHDASTSSATSAVRSEAKTRGLSLDDSLVKRGTIQVGVSTCQMLASLGAPAERHRTITTKATHIQYVYGLGKYVYVEDDKVTAFQD